MSWPLIKKEEYPSFMKGLLVAFVICFLIWYFHPKSSNLHTGSLPHSVACLPSKEVITLNLAEDILDSEPMPIAVKPPSVPVKIPQVTSGGETPTGIDNGPIDGTIYLPPPYIGPDENSGTQEEEEGIIEPEEPIVDTKEGDIVSNETIVPFTGISTVTPEISTERDATIISTITTTEESQNSNNGSLRIEIQRKFNAS